MARIRGRDTSPELALRRALWSHGARYRIHDGSVPGRPDLSNKRRKVAVFVDGCFWHGCEVHYRAPKTRVTYWKDKLIRNRERRADVLSALAADGWRVIEVWEHDVLTDPEGLAYCMLPAFAAAGNAIAVVAPPQTIVEFSRAPFLRTPL